MKLKGTLSLNLSFLNFRHDQILRIRRAHQMICKGRKGSKRYFRCQLYVEGASNCNYRLVAVEGAKGTYTIFTDNRHNHQVVAIDESSNFYLKTGNHCSSTDSGRHSFAKEPGLTPQHSNSSSMLFNLHCTKYVQQSHCTKNLKNITESHHYIV